LCHLLWSPLFFRLRRPDWALIEVVFLWGSLVALVLGLRPISPFASALILPYLAWVSFCGVAELGDCEAEQAFRVAPLIAGRVADRDHFPLLLASGQGDFSQGIADARAAQGAGNGRAPANKPGGRVLLVVTDQSEREAMVVLVRDLNRGAEQHAVPVFLPHWIDHARAPSCASPEN